MRGGHTACVMSVADNESHQNGTNWCQAAKINHVGGRAHRTSKKSSRQLIWSPLSLSRVKCSIFHCENLCAARRLRMQRARGAKDRSSGRIFMHTHTPTGRPVIKSNLPCNAETARGARLHIRMIFQPRRRFNPARARVPANSLTRDRRGRRE